MPEALSKSLGGEKASSTAKPAGASTPVAYTSPQAQHMPAYALAQDYAPALPSQGGAVQRKAAGTSGGTDTRNVAPPEEEEKLPQQVAVQRQPEEEEESEVAAEQPVEETEDETSLRTQFESEGNAAQTAGGGATPETGQVAGTGNQGASGAAPIHTVAAQGLNGATRPLPEHDRIQESFGRHDVSSVRVQVGGPAERANERLGAHAYTTGNRIAFKQEPDLRLAAHEAAHVVQQRRGVHLKGGIGEAGDPYERQADRAAEAVVAGQSAEDVLDDGPGHASDGGGVQMACACGGGGCSACGDKEEAGQVQMQLEVTAVRESPQEIAGGGGGGDAGAGGAEAGAEPAPEEEQADEEKAVAGAEGVAGEVRDEAEASIAEQTENAEAELATAETTEEPAAEETPATEEREEDDREEEEDEEEEQFAGDVATQATQVTSAGDGPIQRQQCDPPPVPPDREPSEERPPEPPPGDVNENIEPEGPTAEEEDAPCGAEQVAQSLDAAAPTEETQSVAEEAVSSEPEPVADGEGAAASPEGQALQQAAAAGGGGAPAADPAMEAAVMQAEDGRAQAVAGYELSSSLLDAAAGGSAQLRGSNVNFPRLDAGTEADEKRRAEAGRAVEEFVGSGSDRIDDAVAFAQSVIPERVGGAAEAAKAGIEAAAAGNAQALSARIAQARGAATAQAASARSQINSAHDSALAAIEAETMAALEALDAEYTAASTRIPEIEAEQITTLEGLYAEGDAQYRAVGDVIGAEATARGEFYANHYDGCHIYKEDSFWDGHLTDRRADARMKAARDVAKGYKESLVKEANKQADEGAKGLRCDREAVHNSATAALEALDSQYGTTVETLISAQTQAVASAGSTRDQLLNSVEQAHTAALASLDSQEESQLRAIADTRYLQIVTVEQVAHAAAAALQENVHRAVTSLQSAIQSVVTTLTGAHAPDPEVLRGVLAQGAAAAAAGLGTLYGTIESGLGGVEGQINGQGGRSIEALAAIAGGGIAQADEASAGFSQTMSSLEQAAADSFGQLADNHASSSQTMMSAATAGFAQQVTGLQQSYETLNGSVSGRFQQAVAGLETGLRDSLRGMDTGRDSIPHFADEAASKEEPAWKSVVKWVLIIAIIIVVALVIGPAVIGAVGAWAGSAAAGAIIGGAIVGAATGAAIQVVNNWASNQAWHTGVGKAAIMGAIGGALGGAAGFYIGQGVSSAATQFAMSKVTARAVEFGLNIASDAVLEIGTQLVTTGKVNWEDFGFSMLMSVVTNGAGEIPAVKNIQGSVTTRVEGAFGGPPGVRADAVGPRPGAEVETAAPRPDTDAAAPRPEADTAAPRTEGEAAGTAPRPEGEGATPRAESEPPRTDADVEAETTARAESGQAPRPGTGDTPRLDSDPDMPANQRTDSELAEAAAPSRVGEVDHGVVPRQFLGETKLFACSPSCAPITAKIDAMLEVPTIDPHLRTQLEGLKADIHALEARIEAGEVSSQQIVRETARVSDRMSAIGAQHPELGSALNAPPSGGTDTQIRQREANDWGVDPETGTFDPNGRMQGKTPAEVEALAAGPPRPGEPDPVRRRRRHIEERAASPTPPNEPMPMNKWAESGFTANVNRQVSSPQEAGALGSVGATPNNAAGQRLEHTHTEHFDANGRPVAADSPQAVGSRTETTRPDGTRPNSRGGTDMIEHKHLTGDTDVLNDSQQLRAQREMAEKHNGDHEIVMSSDRPLVDGNPPVHPSAPLGESGSRIYYNDPATGRVTHQWVAPGRWRRVNPGARPAGNP